jgi:hypothetical protein
MTVYKEVMEERKVKVREPGTRAMINKETCNYSIGSMWLSSQNK